jgi:hypothetical protein
MLHSGRLRPNFQTLKLGIWGFTRANTQAYYRHWSIMAEKCFIPLVPGRLMEHIHDLQVLKYLNNGPT